MIKALDDFTPKQIGENGNVEYTWSNNVREQITQLHFQLTRTNEESYQIVRLENQVRNILQTLKQRQDSVKYHEVTIAYLTIMYRMIGYTRDIIDGKGEYTLTYMMIYVWHDYYPELAQFALKCLFYLENENSHPYGSWKDIKKFCQYCSNKDLQHYQLYNDNHHPLIYDAIQLLNDQIRKDKANMDNQLTNISLAAKWAPREKSSCSWLFKLLAQNYFSHYLESGRKANKLDKAELKCYTDYRKLLTGLNRKLDTLQIKQCENRWSDIDFNKVTSISFSKQKNAFLNIINNHERYPDREDRVICAQHFTEHIQKSIREGKEIKGKRVGMESFTKQALELLRMEYLEPSTQLQIDLLNSQWRDNSTQTDALGKMIAMVDVSGSMNGDPLNAAIALGIRVAEKCILGKRVMTFSSRPEWVNLSNCDDFVSAVNLLKNSSWGMNTNLYAGFKMILDSIEESKLPPEEVQDLVLVIFSDMQIDDAEKGDKNTLHENIIKMYSDAGIRIHGKPFKPPHILFWNLRSTSGFPTLSNQPNVTMMSGFNPSLLNLFCEQGIEALQSCSPWSQLERSLENERYNIMKQYALSYFEQLK